jgi:hypothetical protein
MGKSIITTAGAALIAQKQANAQVLTIDQIVFADIPDLDTSVPPSAETVMPAAENIKLQTAIDQTGLIDNTTVVYSKILGSAVGDFYLNWIGLYSSADDVLVAVCYTPRHLKYASDGQRLGNNLVKNFALGINNVSDLTGIVINAETWQWDFSEMFAGIDHNHDDAYEPLGAIVSHVVAGDPHPQYTNERGMILSINDTDPMAVEMSPGKIADSTYTYMMTGIMDFRKKLNAIWVLGEGNGGRAGTVAISPYTWYHYFALYNPVLGTTDAGFDTDINAANLLADPVVIAAGHAHYRYLGSVLTDDNGDIIPGFWTDLGNGLVEFSWDDMILDYDGAIGTETLLTLRTPIDIKSKAIFNWASDTSTGDKVFLFTDPDISSHQSADTSNVYNGACSHASSGGAGAGQVAIFTNTSSQIVASSNVGGNIRIATTGYQYKA